MRQRQLTHVLNWRFFMNLALLLIDAAAFIVAGTSVLLLSHESVRFAVGRFGFDVNVTVYLVVAALIFVMCLHTAGIYHRHVMGDGYQLNPMLLKGSAECWVMLCALNYVLDLSLRLRTMTLIVLAAWLLTMIERVFVRMFITRSREKGAYSYGTVIVGSPEGIGRTLHFLALRQQLNYHPVAVCPIRLNRHTGMIENDDDYGHLSQQMASQWGKKLPVLSYADRDLAEQIVDMQAQTVMVSDVIPRYSDNFDIFSVRMETLGLEVASISSPADSAGHEIQVRSIQGTTIITQRLAQYTPAALILKRLFDIVVSLIAIIVSSPFMLGVAIAIKLEDHGPVFYAQERIGRRGKPFKIHKFRSMRVDADKHLAELAAANGQKLGARVKLKQDPRITRVGHVIRKTSLDELPQFFDSLLGTMSVVGPRPQRQFEVDEYNPVYATRLLVKPGITGPWQVSGRNDLSQEESEALDVSYVQNWSIMGDIVYILRTIGTVIHPHGAY